MGRYSIDRPGLVLSKASDTAETFAGLVPSTRFECDYDVTRGYAKSGTC